jgi:type I restriction enzyme M protein
MLGAIVGDIVGSQFEGTSIVPEDFVLFTEKCKFTDDTVHTIAIADAIYQSKTEGTDLKAAAIKCLQEYGRRYLWCGCGDLFYKWLFQENPKPYGSYGNGAAMRISPCAWAEKHHWRAIENTHILTNITHNHSDSIDGACAVTTGIWLAKKHKSKKQIINAIRQLHRIAIPDYESLPRGEFDVTCKGTVKKALAAFIASENFEDCIRKAILLGGDTDTTAAVSGSIAEAFYGIPEKLQEEAKNKLDDYLREKLELVESIKIASPKRTV